MKVRMLLPALAAAMLAAGSAHGASHREAPLIALDAAADNTDVFFFVSYGEENLARAPEDRRVTLIANFIPGQEPGDGPNYFAFDDDVVYRLLIDNNADGIAEDIVYEFRFTTEERPIPGLEGTPLPFLGGIVTGGITTLDGPGSEGLTRGTWTIIAPGVAKKSLHFDDTGTIESFLIRFDPGAHLDSHEHLADEECMMLSGELSFGDLTLRAGDYHLAPGSVVHGDAYSPNGAPRVHTCPRRLARHR